MAALDETGRDFDLDIAMSHVGGDTELLAELAELFVKDYPRLLKEMQDAVSADDHAVLERGAHTLKGRLAFFGVHEIRDKALALEMMGRNHQVSTAAQMLAEVEAGMKSVLRVFASLAVRENG
jgi:HPt (histidine-containing phosphotransfer) domain-containing protein